MNGESRAQKSTLKRSREQRIAAMDKNILDVEGAAALLGVSTRTIYTLARKGEIPATRVGREWRFARQNLIAWVAWDRLAVSVTRETVARSTTIDGLACGGSQRYERASFSAPAWCGVACSLMEGGFWHEASPCRREYASRIGGYDLDAYQKPLPRATTEDRPSSF